jgi:hypothetical protein
MEVTPGQADIYVNRHRPPLAEYVNEREEMTPVRGRNKKDRVNA